MKINLNARSLFGGLSVEAPNEMLATVNRLENLVNLFSKATGIPALVDVASDYHGSQFIRFSNEYGEKGRGVEVYLNPERPNRILIKSVWGVADSTQPQFLNGFSANLIADLKHSYPNEEFSKRGRGGVSWYVNFNEVDVNILLDILTRADLIYTEMFSSRETNTVA